MLNYNIDTLEKADKLTKACKKFEEDVNVLCGRLIIDGKSYLGVVSLLGKVVGLEILTEDEKVKEKFKKKIKEID